VVLTAQASAMDALFSGERRDHGTIKCKRGACRRNKAAGRLAMERFVRETFKAEVKVGVGLAT
jgi:hypothetical protein